MSDRETGMAPSLAPDIPSARAALAHSGAVRLQADGLEEADARALLAAVVGDVQALPPAALVSDGGGVDKRRIGSDHHDALTVHTDGFAYGDLYPDYLMLLCINASPVGGESILVDGYAVLDDLAADVATAAIASALAEVPVDQTEDGMQPSCSPIVLCTLEGRRMVRRIVDEHGLGARVAPGSATPERDQTMIDTWTAAILRAERTAPRFALAPGEALIVDNYRCFHGREGYTDPSRSLWRVWAWSAGALGVPDLPLHSDTRFARDPSALPPA